MPGTPICLTEGQDLLKHQSSQFSWKKKISFLSSNSFWQPVMQPCLDNLDLPYADDSTAVTPNSDYFNNFHIAQAFFMPHSKEEISG